MKKKSNITVPYPLLLIFVLAVLVPSVVLGFLALRAAERESLYVERRLESALLAEADLAARRVEALMNNIAAELQEESASGDATPAELVHWMHENSLVGVPFVLRDGQLTLPDLPREEREAFTALFGGFLVADTRLPVFEAVARVYRREMADLPDKGDPYTEKPATSSFAPLETLSDSVSAGAAVPMLSQAAPLPSPPVPAPAREQEAYDLKPMLKKRSPTAPAPADGIRRQIVGSEMEMDADVREEVFQQAGKEGFEISQRNVMPQAQSGPRERIVDNRSRTVSRGQTFEELRAESDGGLLPRLADDGLHLLFWSKRSDGVIVGCALRMDTLHQRIADAIPDLWSEARILTVLDENGLPLVAPSPESPPDWRRPFVAREIAPQLPRWEVGIWLTDPAILASRARFAEVVVSVLVATLFLVIAVGGFAVMRMLSYEMRLAAQKTTFVANVSHELKTPLTSIRLFAELLLSGRQTDEKRQKEYLRTMVSETERLSHLIDNVLAFSRKGDNKPMHRLSLSDIVRETADQFMPHLVKSDFDVVVEADAPLPIHGNRESLMQVVMNLLSNAEKYSGDTREISISTRAEGHFAVLDVQDRGIGVDPAHASKIFQEFFRSDDSLAAMRSGAGLGLHIAREIARKHGGDIVYTPRRGGGSVFSLRLPLHRDPTSQEEEQA